MKTERIPLRKGLNAQIKNSLMLICLLFSLSVISGCSDDGDEPQEAPKEETNGEQSEPTNTNGHEYVDLGLPSGLLWATCNVGATNPEDFGDYFAWGETVTKSEYTRSNSTTCGKTMADISGNAEYDVARANWGGTWRIPTKTEIEELINNCTWEWITLYWSSNNEIKARGYIVTGPNGNNIFLPAAGYRDGSSLGNKDSFGGYWSSSSLGGSSADGAYSLFFDSGNYYSINYYRYFGLSVRPVTD